MGLVSPTLMMGEAGIQDNDWVILYVVHEMMKSRGSATTGLELAYALSTD